MSTSPTPTSVTIPSKAPFLSAIDHYADENKPDPLSLKQLKGLSVEWENRTTPSEPQQQFNFDPSHVLQGTLSITGEYMVVRLNIVCAWTFDESAPKYGNLSYKCCASAEMLPKSSSTEKSKDKKVEEKIRSKMQKRLQKDAYISKLLLKNGESSLDGWPLFASAEIMFLPTELEERVDVSQPIAEAIKRAVWSAAESNLDIVDLILHFPSLPSSLHKDTLATTTTELANRAKLRLLEDAMVDACEQEGEDQILEDLSIDGEKKKEEEDDDNGTEKSRSKKSRRSKDT